jgi:hypothetical protein
MDPSTSSAQDAQNQKASDPGITNVQPPAIPAQPPQQPVSKAPVTISVNKEGPSAVIAAESSIDDEDDEEEQVAPQENKTQGVQQAGGDGEEEAVDVEPSAPEVSASAESAEVERVVEKTPDVEPKITPELKKVGVTHSGPGIIPDEIKVSENNFGIKKLPVSFEQAALEEKKTKLHDSKHWFSAMMMYIWRRLNPQLGKAKPTTGDATSSFTPAQQTPVSAPTNTPAVVQSNFVQKFQPDPDPDPEPKPDANVAKEEGQKEVTSV